MLLRSRGRTRLRLRVQQELQVSGVSTFLRNRIVPTPATEIVAPGLIEGFFIVCFAVEDIVLGGVVVLPQDALARRAAKATFVPVTLCDNAYHYATARNVM